MADRWNPVLFLAIAGILAVMFGNGWMWGATINPHAETYPAYQDGPQVESSSASLLTRTTANPHVMIPCLKMNGTTESDLCAQWHAANAAEQAALWSMLSVVLAAIGSVALLWQLRQTRRALQETTRSTAAMAEANLIARQQHRPWLLPKIGGVGDISFGNGKMEINFILQIMNHGAEISSKIVLCIEILDSVDAVINRINAHEPRERARFAAVGKTLAPGATMETRYQTDFTVPDGVAHEQMMRLYLLVTMSYEFPLSIERHTSIEAFDIWDARTMEIAVRNGVAIPDYAVQITPGLHPSLTT